MLWAVVLAALVTAAPAEARRVKIQQQLAPELTITVPDGWRIRETRRFAVLTRGERTIGVFQCPLARSERDMTGRHAARTFNEGDAVMVPVRGGTCLAVTGDGARAFARRLRPRLGPASAPPASDAAAEKLARDARRRTLAMARVTGTASVTSWESDGRIDGTFEWDLPAGYRHHAMTFGNFVEDVVRTPAENRLRTDDRPDCWSFTPDAEEDDAFEPRLELQEWNAPPATATSWRVAYAPAEPQPDDSTLVRWTGYVADGEAVIASDGRLRRVRIEDHRTASGRTAWRTLEIAFTGFPAAITPVRTEPACS
jgi:hypothetical protein